MNTGQVRLTHPQRVLWPSGPGGPARTKADYLVYLAQVAPWVLPHLRDRPLVLTRYPRGAQAKGFYQKQLPAGAPPWLRSFPHLSAAGRLIRYLVVDSPAALLWLGQQAALEFHPWMSRVDDPEHPDLAVIDLDPMPPTGFAEARAVAMAVGEFLDRVGVRAWPKTSGATGVHLFVPVPRGSPWQQVREHLGALALALSRRWPERVTVERAVHRRGGRVYFDYLQNGAGRTVCAPYSPRPLPGAPVSTPLRWDELERGTRPEDWNLETVALRLRRQGDAWADLRRAPPQDLGPLRGLAPVPSGERSQEEGGVSWR